MAIFILENGCGALRGRPARARSRPPAPLTGSPARESPRTTSHRIHAPESITLSQAVQRQFFALALLPPTRYVLLRSSQHNLLPAEFRQGCPSTCALVSPVAAVGVVAFGRRSGRSFVRSHPVRELTICSFLRLAGTQVIERDRPRARGRCSRARGVIRSSRPAPPRPATGRRSSPVRCDKRETPCNTTD
jgi:hypothetical protein